MEITIALYLKVWACNLCGDKGFGNVSSIDHILGDHLAITDDPKCPCGKNFEKKLDTFHHMQDHHLVVEYICKFCNIRCPDLIAIRNHVEDHK